MSDPKLISLLKKLSPEEFSELEKFVISPYFARGRNFEPLFRLLKPFYPEFKAEKLPREFLFSKLYKGEKYDPAVSDNKVKILFTGLYKLCLDFLTQTEYNSDKYRKNYYLLNQLRVKKLYNEYEKTYASSQQLTGSHLKGSFADFINRYFFLQSYKNYTLDRDEYDKMFRASVEMRENGLVAGLIDCLKYQNEKNIMTSYNIVPPVTIMEELMLNLDLEKLLNELKKKDHRFYPQLYVNYLEYRMQKSVNNIEYLEKLKKYLHENAEHFGRMEMYAMYIRMESYCLRHSASGDFRKIMMAELFSVYREMLELNVYKSFDTEDFNIVLFRNIVMNAFLIKEFKWLEGFLEKYSGELNETHRSDMKNYAISMLEAGKGNYEKALSHLMKIEFELFLYKTDVRMEILKMYYELESTDQFYSSADATIHYLRNTTIHPEKTNSGYRNFVMLVKELVRLRYEVNRTEEDIEFLKKKISDAHAFFSEWLKDKVNEMMTGSFK